MSTARLGKRRKTGAHDGRFDGRQIALNVDHDIVDAVGVDGAQRLENAVGPGGVIEAGHDRFAAGRGDRLHDARIVRRHPDRSDIRLRRPAPDMDDHRRAVNVGERLSRQAGRVHARGDEDDGIGHQFRLSQIRGATAYTCCQGERKAANQLSKTNAPAGSPTSLQLTKVLRLMDHVNVNRVSLSALGAVLFVMLLTAFSNLVLSPRTPKVPGFALPTGAPAAATAAAPAAAPEEPLPALLAKADAKKGEQDAKICETCHNFQEGEGAKIGPDLWNVVGRQVASVPGFAYSDALKRRRAATGPTKS